LQEIGKWKFRQFIKPQLVIGNNRLDSNSDKLTLNGETGINGFSSESLFGNKKILMNFQTQGYSPWRVLGFRLNPYLSYTGGMLGQKSTGFKQSKLYSQISLGVIISNDYLVFNSFQFSISFYPNNPDSNSLFKTNAISTSNFGLQGFEISQPVLVDYR
jgi:hemolysin activation/secretion protein